ncbi:MAG: SelT/SelW/SelH family protein [Proteobacteria bacterium]|nr:SelT/SelW/SelH family protein [Pseudomonadota bacterium]MDE3208755.1 SelT/SelW/SelH family protein [Pseudomonadota bacterium]
MSASPPINHLKILYCTQCNWMLRSTWIAQELLTTFPGKLTEVSLIPSTGGLFEIWLNTEMIWNRKEKGRFPELREIKQLVRDIVDPGRSLGHSDNP